MKRKSVLALLLAAVVGLSGCSMLDQIVSKKQTSTQTSAESEQLVEIDTGDGVPFIETMAEADGAGSETELADEQEETFMVVPDTESEMQAGTETESEAEALQEPVSTIVKEVIAKREAMNERWAVGYEDLASGEVCGYHDTSVMQSASVVKLFIMGAVYRYMCYPKEGEEAISFGEEHEGQLRETINKMITVSDNDAANLLVDRLGEGDFKKGAELVAEFCKENGYTGTSLGRRFLDPNPTDDNYTTAADTRKFLSDIYHGKLINEEASAKMLEVVKAQAQKNKNPAGLPEGFTSGNKTGEMPEGYNLGCIENDVAIVFPPEGKGEGYILTILSNELAGRNNEAISEFGKMSSMVAQWYLNQ